MMRVLKWIWRRWYLLLFLIGAVLGFLVTRRSPFELFDAEREAINEQERYETLTADHDADLANANANREYQQTINALDDREMALVDSLCHNPGRRVRLLNKLSRRRR